MNEELTYLALGDSYTIGESVDSTERWPVLLSEALTASGVATAAPHIIARTGWTTDELANAIKKAKITNSFDLVSLLIGVNNQYRGLDVEEFRMEFIAILEQAISFTGHQPEKVVVVSIPDWGVTPFAEGRDREKIAAEIDRFNQVKKEESEKRGVAFINITGISRVAETDSSLLAVDGLHPSGKMYRLWVEKIAPVLIEKLQQ